jgi:hypothetical protein
MASNPPAQPPQPARQLHVGAGILSYLVPGLGQIYQRRYAKGILFFVCIYVLFFYGMYIGSGSVTINGRKYTVNSNVYLPRDPSPNSGLGGNLVTRWPFLGQFWVGAAAWPAIFQYANFDPQVQHELENAQDDAGKAVREAEEKEATGAEGAAEARKEANEKLAEAARLERKAGLPLIGSFQREPSPASINAVHNAGDKRLELAWVFTVIAGVLNILVIYDAVVGPAEHPGKEKAN